MADGPNNAGEQKEPSIGSRLALDDNEQKKIGEIVFVIILLYFGSRFLSNLPEFFAARGVDIHDLSTLYEEREPSSATNVGAGVITKNAVEVWGSAGTQGELLGLQALGSKGVLADGPVRIDGVWWWDVDFNEDPDGWVLESALLQEPLFPWLKGIVHWYLWIALLGSLGLLAGTAYSVIRIGQIRTEEAKRYPPINPPVPAPAKPLTSEGTTEVPQSREIEAQILEKNQKWSLIQKYIQSEAETDWRLAILEADVMLDELMEKIGYHQETLGEKLAHVHKADFKTIEFAWQAHKMRNFVAHHGLDYSLSHEEAKKTIDMYRRVFEEFNFI